MTEITEKKFDNKSYLNDWLTYEFKTRTRKNIVLTSDLSEAFDLLKISGVSKEMRLAEHAIDLASTIEKLQEAMRLKLNRSEFIYQDIYNKLTGDNINKRSIGQMDLFANFEDLEAD